MQSPAQRIVDQVSELRSTGAIARALGRAKATISRELQRNVS